MKLAASATILLAATLAGCSASPVAPDPAAIALTIASEVTGRVVPCESCELPAVTAVATTNITLSNRGTISQRVAAVDTIVMNQTRRTVVAANRRPNADVALGDVEVPAHGWLTLEAGVVYPVPPPRDDIRLLVIVTMGDGTRVQQQARLITAAA